MFERRKLFRKLSGLLPRSLRYKVLRKNINFALDRTPDDLVIKVAETKDEFEQAYQLLHDCYVEFEFQNPDPHGLRVIKYSALPTTTTIVAKLGDRVIGTVTLISRGAFGIPAESAFDISALTESGQSVVEVTSLAIASSYRHQRGAIFLPLCTFVYHYVVQDIRADHLLVTVHPKWGDLYEGLFLFSPLGARKTVKYAFANGAPAIALVSRCSTWPLRLEKTYRQLPDSQNLFKMATQIDRPCFYWPERSFMKAMDPMFTTEMLDYFFNKKSDVFSKLTEQEKLTLQAYYESTEFEKILPEPSFQTRRVHNRYMTMTTAIVNSTNLVRVLDSSLDGLKVQGRVPVGNFEIKVKISRDRYAALSGETAWRDQAKNMAGIKIKNHDSVWQEYIQYLDADLRKRPTAS